MLNRVIAKSRQFFCKHLTDRVLQLESRCSALEHSLSALRTRTRDYHHNRWDVLDCAADYLVNAELPGDYAEFGVFEGKTFGYCANLFGPLFPHMRFLAFDSFRGLPELTGIDTENDFSSGFYKGQFACTEAQFLKNVEDAAPGLDMKRVITVPGWFDQTLTPETARKHQINKLSCLWIDCDLYESTVPILKFIRPLLSVGTIILFDDWRCYRNLPDYGQQRACKEWLDNDRPLSLAPFISFGFHGQSFTVLSC